MQFQDHYRALGVEFDATPAALEAAWRAASERWHPARDDSPEAAVRLRDAADAWEVLGSPESRAEYDRAYFYLRQEEARRRERTERERQQATEHPVATPRGRASEASDRAAGSGSHRVATTNSAPRQADSGARAWPVFRVGAIGGLLLAGVLVGAMVVVFLPDAFDPGSDDESADLTVNLDRTPTPGARATVATRATVSRSAPATVSPTPSQSPTRTSTATPTLTSTATPTSTSTPTPTSTSTPTRTPTPTSTPSPTYTATPSPTRRPTRTPSPTWTPTRLPTERPSATPMPTSVRGLVLSATHEPWQPQSTPIWGPNQSSGGHFLMREVAGGDTVCSHRISSTVYHGALTFEFVVPTAPVWSIGVRYHDGRIYHVWRDTRLQYESAAYLRRTTDGDIVLEHWTKEEGEVLSRAPSVTISDAGSEILPGQTVSFELWNDHNGSVIVVNGEERLRVAPEDLRPTRGPMDICAGLAPDESSPYTVQINEFASGFITGLAESTAQPTFTATPPPPKTPYPTSTPTPTPIWGLRQASGTNLVLRNNMTNDCCHYVPASAYHGVYRIEFIVPEVSEWSISFVRERIIDGGARAGIAQIAGGTVVVHHSVFNSRELFSRDDRVVDAQRSNVLPGETVKFELRNDDLGSILSVNDEEVMHVPPEELRPGNTFVAITVSFFNTETEPYEIEVISYAVGYIHELDYLTAVASSTPARNR